MLDAAAELIPCPSNLKDHLRTCGSCSDEFERLRRTMLLLDEWRAPEPSPRFGATLNRKIFETKNVTRATSRISLRTLAIASGVAALFLVGAITFFHVTNSAKSVVGSEYESALVSGTAVSDLQTLEEAELLFADFDLLDQLAPAQPESIKSK
jgi:hypothetical protein